MAQKTTDGIKVCSHFDLLLGEEVATGMRTDPNALYPLSVPLDDMLNRRIGQLVIMERYKVVVIFRIRKLLVSCNLILDERLLQYRSNRYDTLLVILAMDDDKILMDICVPYTTQLPTADTCLKKGS